MKDRFDLAIIGGGIHGAGVAFVASARGYDVLLVEKGDLAEGTSSRSSKLIHGGLRYLETAQFSLVRESLAERAWHLEHAASLVRLRPFVIPVYRGQRRGPLTIRAGLTLYSLLAGLSPDARFRSFSPANWKNDDGLQRDGLRRVFRYADAQTDDAALTRAIAARAK
ncbi:MAG: FAD-dependent oxidoreductase, partial [Gemmatimonadetes bacterium]|nr:FAD-dependent oxidoreductase [Gemmatimonadota bacterium]